MNLNLGCGGKLYQDAINADINPVPGVQIILDINQPYLPFKDNSFDEVYCEHVLEHINNVIHGMNEIWRILKYKGLTNIEVPWWTGIYNVGDPTHKHLFNHKSFDCYQGENAGYKYIGVNCRFLERDRQYKFQVDFHKDKFLTVGGFSPIMAMVVVFEKIPQNVVLVN